MAGRREVDRIKRRVVSGKDRKENTFGDKRNAVLSCERALNPTVFVSQRWKRQLKHDDLPVRCGHVGQSASKSRLNWPADVVPSKSLPPISRMTTGDAIGLAFTRLRADAAVSPTCEMS